MHDFDRQLRDACDVARRLRAAYGLGYQGAESHRRDIRAVCLLAGLERYADMATDRLARQEARHVAEDAVAFLPTRRRSRRQSFRVGGAA